jgi:hypothetical protein
MKINRQCFDRGKSAGFLNLICGNVSARYFATLSRELPRKQPRAGAQIKYSLVAVSDAEHLQAFIKRCRGSRPMRAVIRGCFTPINCASSVDSKHSVHDFYDPKISINFNSLRPFNRG